MKGLIITGLIFLGLGAVLFYVLRDFSFDQLFDFNFLIGIFFGLGIGQFVGGIIGYVSKGSSVKEAQRRQEMAQLQKEKQALEQQNAHLVDNQYHQNPSL